MRMEISQRVAGHTCSLERLQEKIKRDVVKKGEFEWELRKENKKKKEAYNTCKYWAGPTLLNFSDLVYTVWYGRRQQRLVCLAF